MSFLVLLKIQRLENRKNATQARIPLWFPEINCYTRRTGEHALQLGGLHLHTGLSIVFVGTPNKWRESNLNKATFSDEL